MSHEAVNPAQMGAHLSEPPEVTVSRIGRNDEWGHLRDARNSRVITHDNVSTFLRNGLTYNAHSGARLGA